MKPQTPNNEVARLRNELATMTRLFLGACESAGNLSDEEEAMWEKLNATAPEETHEGVTMDEWYGGFSKIESTEPVTEKNTIISIKEPAPEWRIKSPKEHIEEGDEYSSNQFWLPVPKRWIGQFVEVRKPKVRTRRQLPKQKWIPNPNYETATHVVDLKFFPHDEIPLDTELKRLEDRDWITDPIPDITTCIRYLRDEIQRLKQTNNL